MTTAIPLCASCRRFHDEDQTQNACDAFPDGVPSEIILGADHTRPWPGDRGLRYEPVEGAGAPA